MSFILFAFALIVSYALIGSGIKIIDQATDFPDQFQSRKFLIWIVTLGLVIIVNIWVFFDIYSAVFAIGIILGLVASWKVDNKYFLVVAIAVLPLSIFRILEIPLFMLLLPTLIAVFLSSLIDELLHAQTPKIQNRILHRILVLRPILKITVLLLPFLGLLTFLHTIAFWAFDFAYEVVTYYFGAIRPTNT